MADSFVQLPPDSTGKKLRTRDRGVAGHDQYVALAAAETWDAYADVVAFAQNKHHISIFNASGSGKIVKVKKLFAVNLQTAAVTGVAARFDFKKITAASAGTVITPQTHDSGDAVLPAQVTVRSGGTVTEGALHFPWVTSNDEETAVAGLSKALFQQSVNIIPEGPEVKEYVAREGQGYTLKQITNTVLGSYGWFLVFTVE